MGLSLRWRTARVGRSPNLRRSRAVGERTNCLNSQGIERVLVARSANTTRAKRRGRAHWDARGCRRPREATGGGGFLLGGRRRGGWGEIRGILQFEPIKSMVSRGRSPIGAGWGRKRGLKLVTQHQPARFGLSGAEPQPEGWGSCTFNLKR